MTAPAYERDPYLRELATTVVAAGLEEGRPYAILADTLFYPEGGGQPADRGWAGAAVVEDVRRGPEGIRHYLSAPLALGPVELRLDWPRRLDHMQQHTGQHLLTAVAEDRFGWATTAFHLGGETSDVELLVPRLEPAERARLEEAVAEEIRAARPVEARIAAPDELAGRGVRTRGVPAGHEGPVRLVAIGGLDLNTCGGTHLKSTAEIGALALLGTEALRGGTRLFFAAGDRVRRRLAVHEGRAAALRALLGVPDAELPEAVAARLEQAKELGRRLRSLSGELAEARAAGLAMAPGRVVGGYYPGRDPEFLQRLGRELQRLAPAKAALLTAEAGDQACFLVVAGPASGLDAEAAGRQVAVLLQGRGGGRGGLYQGKAGTLARRDEALAHLSSLLGG